MAARRAGERGSAMVEAAIVFPCLVLILYWSATLTDALLLKLKAAEALRYALWENTVFKAPAQIDEEVRQRFADLRSPKSIDNEHTGLFTYPLASDLSWKARVDTTAHGGGVGGERAALPTGSIRGLFSAATSALAKGVDENLRLWKFNLQGEATVSVALEQARHEDQPRTATFEFAAPLPSERPMRLVFDAWKAWPRPAAYTRDGAPADVSVSPSQTYPVVEEQVARQVDRIAFFGLNNLPLVGKVRALLNTILRGAVTETIVGGQLPDVLSAERMDGPQRGPLTILPPDRDDGDPSWVPGRCEIAGREVSCPTHRLGDLTGSSHEPQYLEDDNSMGDHVDRSRYTIPYRINTAYWTESGGIGPGDTSRQLGDVPEALATRNEYVKSWECRGHYFAGSIRPQETDPSRRYKEACTR